MMSVSFTSHEIICCIKNYSNNAKLQTDYFTCQIEVKIKTIVKITISYSCTVYNKYSEALA